MPAATSVRAPALEVERLDIAYRRGSQLLSVVSDVSFTIQRGAAYGLVGESGCGKTTVAMAIMRYMPDNAVLGESSRIHFNGADLLGANRATLRKWRGNRMSMVYQNPGSALNPTMLVGTQIAELYRIHQSLSRSDALAASADMLSKVRIPEPHALMKRYPHQLSGGQQQRVMIAMALASNPDLLVLDEPTTGLDATVEAEVIDLVDALRAEFQTAVLFISHNLGIVSRLCDEVGVLYAGRLVEQGPSAPLFANPRHPYTLGLLRSAPRDGIRKSERILDSIPGSLPPSGSDLPGCTFAPRCPITIGRCSSELPSLDVVAPGRSVRCFRHEHIDEITPSMRAAEPVPVDTSEVLLRVEHLTKRYRSGGHEVTAVSDVSFDVKRGEVFGLVGESGSGKTTLAKCIVGMLKPSEGTVTCEDADLTYGGRRRARAVRRRVQMVFQNPDTALNPRHTVSRILGRAISLLGDLASREERHDRLQQLARSVRLEPRHLGVRPNSLSGGLKQRVAIARAFAGSPALVLCDEPVSALDVSVQAAILNLLVDLQAAKGVSYVFITHDMSVVRYIADRVAVMYLGELVEVGPTDAVFQAPRHPYTEALMSSAPSLDSNSGSARIRLEGNYPTVADPPSGCRFHTRCPRALGDLCRTEQPPWRETANGNRYRCHIEPTDLARLQQPGNAAPSTTRAS